jgi:hypothetical protein
MTSKQNKKNKLFANSLLAVTVIGASLLLPGKAQAALLLGTLNFNGNLSISTGLIDFQTTTGGPTGTVTFTSSTGDYTPFAGSTGTLQDINNSTFPIPTGAGFLDFFLTSGAFPAGVKFTMTQLFPGIQGTAGCVSGPNCTPPNSPYNLTNTSGTTSTASFTVSGVESDGVTTTPFTGVFTAQFGTQFQPLLAAINGNGTVTTSFSGTIVTAAPEPGSLPMLAGGVLILGLAFGLRKYTGLLS